MHPDYSVLTDKVEGEARQIHWGDMWHYALARLVVVARANGLRPIDGPFGNFSDPDAFIAAANRAAALGDELVGDVLHELPLSPWPLAAAVVGGT
mgnify:CR=1 FL=1